MVLRRLYLAAACALVASLAARADEPPIIAKARAYIGSEAALDAVRSVHFVGTMTTSDPADPERKVSAKVDIIFQRPSQHRIMIDNGQVVRTIALDDYDVWERTQNAADPGNVQVAILPVDMVRNLSADVWENLYFYRGIEAAGGDIEDQGPVTVDGVSCEKIAFVHSPKLVYTRYFDRDTGKLVYTETASGFRIREQGETVVDGLRFPKSLVSTRKDSAGRDVATTYAFDKIAINEVFPDSVFAIPPPQAPRSAPAPRLPAGRPSAPAQPSSPKPSE